MPKTLNYNKMNRIIKLSQQNGVIRPRDLKKYGIHRNYLYYLYEKGVLKRLGRGLYALREKTPSEHQTLIEVSKKVPGGIVCLISALYFHGLTDQLPFELWIAIDRKSWYPENIDLPVRIMHFSRKTISEGVRKHKIESNFVKVFCPSKTIADCFKYRNKIGLDVAIEALKEYRKSKAFDINELWHYAKICRVSNVMKPYLESLK